MKRNMPQKRDKDDITYCCKQCGGRHKPWGQIVQNVAKIEAKLAEDSDMSETVPVEMVSCDNAQT